MMADLVKKRIWRLLTSHKLFSVPNDQTPRIDRQRRLVVLNAIPVDVRTRLIQWNRQIKIC